MAGDNYKDPVILSDQVKAAMAADPELAKAMKEVMANMRQAFEAVKAGTYPSFDAAMEAITGQKPERLTVEEEVSLELTGKLPEKD